MTLQNLSLTVLRAEILSSSMLAYEVYAIENKRTYSAGFQERTTVQIDRSQ